MNELPADDAEGPVDNKSSGLAHWTDVEELFVTTSSAAMITATFILRSRHDAEDVVQDALVEAVRNFHQLRDTAAAQSWFRTIVARKALDLQKQRKRSFPSEMAEVWEVAAGNLPPERHAQVEEALRFIDRLPERQRQTYLLRHYLGLKLAEIATVLGCAEKTVTSQLRKAQAKVDKKFGEKKRPVPDAVPARLRGSKA